MTDTTTIQAKSLLRRKLDLLLRTGKLLVESAADTNRIMRNMKRTAAYLGLPEENLHIYITYSMLMVNLSDEQHSFSKFQRCERHGVNMAAIDAVSKLSWRAIREVYSLDRYEKELEKIRTSRRDYPLWLVTLGTGLACGGLCIQFGGDWISFFYAAIAAAAGYYVRGECTRRRMNTYMGIALTAFLATVVAWCTTLLPAWTATPLHPLLACALFLVPGVPLINFVDDMLDNYVHVGITRATNALLTMAAMSFGIAFFLKVSGINASEFTEISVTPHNSYWSYAVAAAISAAGFSMMFNLPRRLLWGVALGGVVAVCVRNLISLGPDSGNFGLGMGIALGSFAGSTVVSLIAVKAVHWFHTPNHCLTIPSVITLMPGLLMYRALVSVIDMDGATNEVTNAVGFGLSSAFTLLGISVGVAIPNIFARHWIAADQKRYLRRIIAARRARGKFIDLNEIK